ncbi:uncharacterized protein E5676_scaffold121G001200 [Cucumis melo var. makuwa]|uniref:RNase H type-1 domain-containing protein n=1 Tax=Cucumis melo var. makuwa TaxID=1194695 RepID=A0A5D3BZK2_CUCMM|nr:uncharacterized protein E5676_scaffold121G001200 [Cucumis melo var. makuwa]
MKRKTFVTLSTSQGSLKVKRHDVILTNSEKEDLKQGQGDTSCHHITIREELEIETLEEDAEDAPQCLEDGGQSTVDELKEEMPGLNPKVAVRHLTIKPGHRSIKQAQRCFGPELIPKIEVEVNKFIEAGFIQIMVDAITRHEALSFMDGSSGYNQIRMALSNEEMTTFKTPKGIYYYKERCLGALLAQEEEKGKGRTLYYLSRTLVGAKVNCSPIEKMCLSLFFAIDKLRHYMQTFTVHLVAKADPIKYVLFRPIISGRLAKWAVLLQQYNIVYIPQKAIKGQALVDFLADHPIPSDWKLCEDLPDDEVFFTEVMEPWTMYFDGAARRSGARVGIVLISPEKHMLPYSFALAELCSNNVAEYQALIIGLQMALEIEVSLIEIHSDSKLIINQLSM